MGLFDGLFEKKTCDICDGEIGLFGNRKLEDGNLCKECAAKLSPWFSDRSTSTVEEIREQLEYREANKEKVAAFNVTRSFGEGDKLLIDEDAGLFVVTDERDLERDNPDVLSFADVTGCVFDISEDTEELMHEDAEGNEVGYEPPRYLHSYDFAITIQVNHPYFDEMSFRLNNFSVEIEDPEPPCKDSTNGQTAKEPASKMAQAANIAAAAVASAALAAKVRPENNVDYREYKAMGEEIREVLLQARQQAREEAAPKAAVNCPHCGAPTTPDAEGRCEFCGSAIA